MNDASLNERVFDALMAAGKRSLADEYAAANGGDEPVRTIVTKAELEALPAGSIVTSPFPDMESNVAERTSDGHWLITGETYLNSTFDLFDSADSPFVVVRHGYDDVMTDARDRVRSRAQALLDKYDNTPVYSAEQLSTNPLLQDELLAAGEVVDALRELLERI